MFGTYPFFQYRVFFPNSWGQIPALVPPSPGRCQLLIKCHIFTWKGNPLFRSLGIALWPGFNVRPASTGKYSAIRVITQTWKRKLMVEHCAFLTSPSDKRISVLTALDITRRWSQSRSSRREVERRTKEDDRTGGVVWMGNWELAQNVSRNTKTKRSLESSGDIMMWLKR
jgi:hypothetical protein